MDMKAAEPVASPLVLAPHGTMDLRSLRSRLLKVGWVEEVAGHDDLFLLHLESTHMQDPFSAWQFVCKALDQDGVAVYPTLVGSDGAHHYPTGAIVVRFEATTAPCEFEAFAKDHALALQEGQQSETRFSFTSESGGNYLPGLVDELRGDSRVRSAHAAGLVRSRRLAEKPQGRRQSGAQVGSERVS